MGGLEACLDKAGAPVRYPTPSNGFGAEKMHAYRTHTCGQLRPADAGAAVRLSGWVHRKRDHGGLLFIDLRDNYGLTQIVIAPSSPAFAAAEKTARRKRHPHRRQSGRAHRRDREREFADRRD